MSEEGGFGIAFMERFFGLLLLIIGGLTTYFTFTSIQELGAFSGFFGLLGIIVAILGLVMVTARTE